MGDTPCEINEKEDNITPFDGCILAISQCRVDTRRNIWFTLLCAKTVMHHKMVSQFLLTYVHFENKC
jgi:hypothetical protein